MVPHWATEAAAILVLLTIIFNIIKWISSIKREKEHKELMELKKKVKQLEYKIKIIEELMIYNAVDKRNIAAKKIKNSLK